MYIIFIKSFNILNLLGYLKIINIKNKLLTNRFDIYVFLDVDIGRLQHYTNYAFLRAPHKHLVQFPKKRPCDLIFSGNCIVCIV